MESNTEAVLCTRCGIHPVNISRKGVAKGLCCNKCPSHGPWCSSHMVHHQCADSKPQPDETKPITSVQKKPAARAENGRRASIKPKEPKANTPKKPAGERRDPIEAALHRVEMEFNLKAMQEQKQHDQRKKNDQRANAEVDQLLRRRQSLRRPMPKCQASLEEATKHSKKCDDEDEDAEEQQEDDTNETTPSEVDFTSELVMAQQEQLIRDSADSVVADATEKDQAIGVADAAAQAPIEEIQSNNSTKQMEQDSSDASDQQATSSLEKHKGQAECRRRGLAALQVAKTLFGEFVAESEQCDDQNRGLKREHSEVEAMLRDRKSIRLSISTTPKKHLAFDDDDNVETSTAVEEEAMLVGIEVADAAPLTLEEAGLGTATLLQEGEETAQERRRRAEAALHMARVLSKELEDERKQLEKRQRIEENEKREELKAGLADMLRKRAGLRRSMPKAFKTQQAAVNNNDASKVQEDISTGLCGEEVDGVEGSAAPATATVASVVVQADSKELGQKTLPAEIVVESSVTETRASDVASIATKRRSGEGVRRRRSGEAALRMANLLCKELAEEREQHDKQKKGSARVDKVRRKPKDMLRPGAKKAKKSRQAFSDDDDSPILGQEGLSPEGVASVIADEIMETEYSKKVSLGSTPPAKTTIAPQYSERASPKIRLPEDLLFALIANGSPSRGGDL